MAKMAVLLLLAVGVVVFSIGLVANGSPWGAEPPPPTVTTLPLYDRMGAWARESREALQRVATAFSIIEAEHALVALERSETGIVDYRPEAFKRDCATLGLAARAAEMGPVAPDYVLAGNLRTLLSEIALLADSCASSGLATRTIAAKGAEYRTLLATQGL